MNNEEKILRMLEAIQFQLKEQGQQLKEQGQILKALEHSAEVNKAEHDRIFHELANIYGEIKEIRRDLANVELITASNWGEIAKLKKAK